MHPFLGLFGDGANIHPAGFAHHPIQNGKIKLGLLGQHLVQPRLDRRFVGDDPAVLRHGLGKFQGTDGPGLVDDVLLVGGDQRPQDQGLGNPVDDRQIGQRLAGDLAQALAGHQGFNPQILGQTGSHPHHHALEDHPHQAVVDLLEDLGDDRLKRHGQELHLVRGAELVPQVIGHLLDPHLMSRPPQVEEAVVNATTALDEVVGGDP